MHCPKCGQQQVSEEIRFCSRCGFLLTGIADLIANNGIVRSPRVGIAGAPDSPRRRGIKQGALLILLTFLVVPLLLVLALVMRDEPVLALLGLILFGIGGVIRTVYSLMFESAEQTTNTAPTSPSFADSTDDRGALPPSYATPASGYTAPAGAWRDTNDLQPTRGSVTDSTTKLLQKDEYNQ